MERKEQIERIRHMEQLLDRVWGAVSDGYIPPYRRKEIQRDVDTLSAYYGSDEWKQDFADDEAELLPKDLKRGVLSEDGIWNLLKEWKNI